jgi:hypothetical protein
MKRSLIPPALNSMFDAKSESPNTTSRVSGFGAELSPSGAGLASPTGADTAAAIDIGPGLSPAPSSCDGCLRA